MNSEARPLSFAILHLKRLPKSSFLFIACTDLYAAALSTYNMKATPLLSRVTLSFMMVTLATNKMGVVTREHVHSIWSASSLLWRTLNFFLREIKCSKIYKAIISRHILTLQLSHTSQISSIKRGKTTLIREHHNFPITIEWQPFLLRTSCLTLCKSLLVSSYGRLLTYTVLLLGANPPLIISVLSEVWTSNLNFELWRKLAGCVKTTFLKKGSLETERPFPEFLSASFRRWAIFNK